MSYNRYKITAAGDGDLDQLVPLMVDYCAFYETAPGAEALRALATHLRAHPEEGLQLIARDDGGAAAGFATIYWSWSTTRARRIAIMNDLYVAPGQRGGGVGRALIEACLSAARDHGAHQLTWQTAPDNELAQALYDSMGGRREQWVDYHLPTGEDSEP